MKLSRVLMVILVASFAIHVFAENMQENAIQDTIFEQDLQKYWYLGWDAYQNGNYQEAVDFYRKGLQYDITNGGNLYNLACCYGLLGNVDDAVRFLQYSINNGFEDYHHITNDPDFNKVRKDPKFKAVTDSLFVKLEKEKEKDVTELWLSSDAYAKSYLKLPKDFDPDKEYPLIIGLHGYGATGERFIRLFDSFDERDFIYICPETFYPIPVGNDIGYSWYAWSDDEKLNHEIGEKTHEYVVAVTHEMQAKFKVSKTYLLGFSQGCGLAYTTGIIQRELYDGLICFGGWLDNEIVKEEHLKKGKNLKIFIAHGTEDKMVDFESGTNARDLLIENGYDIKFHQFEGGHTVPKEALEDARLWLEF